MSTAPLVQEQLVAVGEVLLLGATSLLSTFVLAGALVYLWLCIRSCRQWNGADHRWERPR
jgi:hypothetical protein